VNYFDFHIGDYMRDTAHLSLLEHGVYMRLLMAYYGREAPIPEDSAERLAGARSPAERKAVRAVLGEFFTLRDGSWHQGKCEKQIEAHREFIAEQQRKGRASAAARKANRGSADQQPEGNSGSTAAQPLLNSGSTESQPPTSHLPLPKIPVGADEPPGSLKTAIYRLGKSLGIAGGILTPEIDRCGEQAVWKALGTTLEAKPAEAIPYFRGCLKPKERGFQC
jgi:uncharacterized protein YdaU (DUF1376 family)